MSEKPTRRGGKSAPLAARHLYKIASRAADMFGQLSSVLSRSPNSPEHLNLLLLETVGKLHTEITSWRKHLAVAAVRSGISQRAVADALQVSRRTVQLWVRDHDQPGTVRPVQDDCTADDDVQTVPTRRAS